MPASRFQPDPGRAGIALCLSGGGYRAALFHLGSLRRLKETGIAMHAAAISPLPELLDFAQNVAINWRLIPSNQRAAATGFAALVSFYSSARAAGEVRPLLLGFLGMGFLLWTVALVFT